MSSTVYRNVEGYLLDLFGTLIFEKRTVMKVGIIRAI